MWTNEKSSWAFDNTFTWADINEGWFGLACFVLGGLLIFFAVGYWYRGGDREEVQRKLDNERNVVKSYREALHSLVNLDPSLAQAFAKEEKEDEWRSWSKIEHDRLIGIEDPDIDVERLAKLWAIIEAQNTREGNVQALKDARKALKEARRAE